MNQKMGTHKFRFSAIMPHSWLYKLKGISRSSRKRLPYTSPPLMLLPQESSVKLFFFLHLFITLKPSSRLKLSSSSLNSHVTLTTYRNHRSSTVGSSSKPVSSSPSDQNYGFSREPESKSVDIKALNRVDSEDPSISDNSSPVLVETVNKKTCDTRTQQKLKKPKAGSSGIRIRANSPKIARRKTKGRTSYTSKRKGNS
ncbi:unnamed protein product [Brassica napus]|uniref:(rape) hypothetical protein n=1 Tax=Brassica napus TaxID=3708 RepID=A0A816KBK0_BRANA|nr:unnamed protein product [Brassica napus]